MPDDFRISDLPTSADFNNLDLMEISQVDENSLSGYTSVKKTMNELGDKLNNSIEYSIDLNTTDKKVIGAINEINSKITATSCSVSKGTNMPIGFPLPSVFRRGNVVVVSFGIQLPTGSYSKDDALWKISPLPIGTFRGNIAMGSQFPTVNFLSDGSVKFNGNQTLNADTWFIGQAFYLTDGAT